MRNWISLKIISADIPGALDALTNAAILLKNVQIDNELEGSFLVSRKDLSAVTILLTALGAETEVGTARRSYLTILRYRFVFIAAATLLFILTLWIPTRVFFIEIEGNRTVPTPVILESADRCGITFGCKRASVRSEYIKNRMIQQIPEIEWVGVNTSGCVAKISVREKSAEEASKDELKLYDIVAAQDGVINDVTITSGTLLCKVGEGVTKGQTLVSGYSDVGLRILYKAPKAEIYATTVHNLRTLSLCRGVKRGEVTGRDRKISLKIGKNLINLYNDSGIYPSSCVKIYSEKKMCLPGGFELPISLILETVEYFDPQTDVVNFCPGHNWMNKFSQKYITSCMVAGRILKEEANALCTGGVAYADSTYICREMICENKEIIGIDG